MRRKEVAHTDLLSFFEQILWVLVCPMISWHTRNTGICASSIQLSRCPERSKTGFSLDMIVLDSLRVAEMKDEWNAKKLRMCFDYLYLLDPILTIALAGGPINTIPSFASCSAKSAFSLKKPYPG